MESKQLSIVKNGSTYKFIGTIYELPLDVMNDSGFDSYQDALTVMRAFGYKLFDPRVDKGIKELKNNKVFVEYRPEKKEMFAQDLTDQNNDPAMYNKTKRGLAKAWEELEQIFTVDMSFSEVAYVFHKHGVRTHHWCMMD